MFDVDLLSSVPTKSDKGCSKHGESYPCSYMPYYITVPLLPLSGYEIGQSVDKLLTLLRHTSRYNRLYTDFSFPPAALSSANHTCLMMFLRWSISGLVLRAYPPVAILSP